jgi:hypothetical protein
MPRGRPKRSAISKTEIVPTDAIIARVVEKDDSVEKKHKGAAIRFDAIKKAEVLRLIREEGYGKCAAAKQVGIHVSTFWNHLKSDPEFADDLSRAEMKGTGVKVENVEGALYNTALAGNVTAQQVYLYNKAGDTWKDRRNLQVTGEITVEASARVLSLALGLPIENILPRAPERAMLAEGNVICDVDQVDAVSTEHVQEEAVDK